MDGIHEGETGGANLAQMGTDATAWAREMSATFWNLALPVPGTPMDPAPGALLHVWLVNAIEAGRAAGYSQGRRDAQAAAREAAERVNNSHGYNMASDAARAAADVVERSIGWPLVEVDEPALPANLAGRAQPEDPAARDQPEDLAGRDDDPFGWEKAAIAGLRGAATFEAPPEPSPIARAADALEQIAETLRVSLNGPRPLTVRIDGRLQL